jgi:hypothetical protein
METIINCDLKLGTHLFEDVEVRFKADPANEERAGTPTRHFFAFDPPEALMEVVGADHHCQRIVKMLRGGASLGEIVVRGFSKANGENQPKAWGEWHGALPEGEA